MKRLALCIIAGLAGAGLAHAQQLPSDVAPGHADPLAGDPYITSTGATVAHPGASQSGGTTPRDRAIQRENNKIDKSICKGC